MTNIRLRIAPSPTGYPHIGTVFQALIDYVFAKKHHGKFLVRIEDTDRDRFVAGAEKAIFDALDWFDLSPNESPVHGGEFGPYRQSERLEIYQKHADLLLSKGHAYRCFCTKERLETVRNDLQAKKLPPMYDRHCRDLDPKQAQEMSLTQPYVIRMKIPDHTKIICHDEIRGDVEFDSSVVDDQVIVKSDGFPTYHLAMVVDDHLMQISHVVRGEEWLSSAPKHILLFDYFGWSKPKFIHTPILRNPDKSKLSKRHGHAAVTWYQEQGYLREAVLNFLITRVWNHPEGLEIFGIGDMIKYFDFTKMHIQGPIVDLQKLDWINGQWLRKLSDDDLISRLQPFKPTGLSDQMLTDFLPLIQDRLHKLSDLGELTSFLVTEPEISSKELIKEAKVDAIEVKAYLEQVVKTIGSLSGYSVSALETALRNLQLKVGWKPRPAFMTIRLALTGQSHTPPLFDLMVVLTKPKVLDRLSHAIQNL